MPFFTLFRSGALTHCYHFGCSGNFHALLLFKTDEELVTARELVHRMVKRAIALDGTCQSQPPRTLMLISAAY